MKPETLESLLLDRSLGELPAETEELLSEYLAAHPVGAARASALEQTVTLAKAAVSAEIGRSTPPRPSAVPAVRGSNLRPELARLAACVALGAFAGWLAHGNRPPERPGEPVGVPAVSSVDGARWVPTAASSAAATAAARPEPPPFRGTSDHPQVARYRLRWDSSMNRPHFEEKP